MNGVMNRKIYWHYAKSLAIQLHDAMFCIVNKSTMVSVFGSFVRAPLKWAAILAPEFIRNTPLCAAAIDLDCCQV